MKKLTIEECLQRLEILFKSYQKDSEFNYQLSVSDSPFNQLKKLVCNKGIFKDKVICNINLHYYLNKTNDVFNKLNAISNYLKKYNIQSDIVVGNHWGECWEFSSNGTTTLEIAEYICNFIDSQVLPVEIVYNDKHEFYLCA